MDTCATSRIGFSVGVAVFEDHLRAKDFTDVSHDGLNARRNGLALDEASPRDNQASSWSNVPNPRLMHAGLFRAALKPVFVGFTQAGGLLSVP